MENNMAIVILRGTVRNLTALEKNGTVKCRLDGYNVMVPIDLVSSMHEGDEVEVAGTMSKGAMHAMAVKNIKQDKTVKVDVTNYVLLIGAAGFLWVLCGVLGLRALGTGEILTESIDDIVSIAGFIIVMFSIRHMFLINKASNQLKYPGM